ncbi:MAG TPA: hypothetical protein DCO75_01365, partial [Fibrobacteres bacterium]|nr:hypothetical protein [Fibrobacterota bacterium]
MTKRQLILLLCGAIVFFGITANVKAGTVYKGYIMCSSGATGYLLDSAGKSVKSWKASGNIVNVPYLLPDGSVMCGVKSSTCSSPNIDGAFPGGRLQKINKDGSTIEWDYTYCPSAAHLCYDIDPMPNGNVLVPADASGTSIIYEIQPSGTSGGSVVWQCQLPDSLATISGTYVNSVKYNKDLDRIVIDMQ